MTTIDTKRLRELAEKATQGPLMVVKHYGLPGDGDEFFIENGHQIIAQRLDEQDACLIDAALNALPALLDAYEALCEIAEQDQINLALDPEWPQRIARAALEGKSK
ncbi:MAG: hypothetical protein WC683_18380 [bacterium]